MKHHSARSPKSIRKTKPNKSPLLPTELKQGQIWKMEGRHVEIMAVGKHLADYKAYVNHKRVSTSSGPIREIQKNLQEKGAKLMRKKWIAKSSQVVRPAITFGKGWFAGKAKISSK